MFVKPVVTWGLFETYIPFLGYSEQHFNISVLNFFSQYMIIFCVFDSMMFVYL